MKFPPTNKIHRDLHSKFGENAQLLEEQMQRINWRYFAKVYAGAFVITIVSLFILIVVVRVALTIT